MMGRLMQSLSQPPRTQVLAVNITVVEIGYVGHVVKACLAEIGNDVTCADVDTERSTV